jgi:hypothetical protein
MIISLLSLFNLSKEKHFLRKSVLPSVNFTNILRATKVTQATFYVCLFVCFFGANAAHKTLVKLIHKGQSLHS